MCEKDRERIAALEEGLREAVAKAHGHGLVRDHPDPFDYCPDRMCAEARALLTERSDGFQTTDDGTRENFVTERDDGDRVEHAKSDCPYPDHYDEDCHGGGPAMRKGD